MLPPKRIVYLYLVLMVVYAMAWSTYGWFLGVHLIKADFSGILISFPIIVGAVSYILVGPIVSKFIDPLPIRKALKWRLLLVTTTLAIFLSNAFYGFGDTSDTIAIFIIYSITHCIGVVNSLLITKVPFILDESCIISLSKIRTFHNLALQGAQIIAPGIAIAMSNMHWENGVLIIGFLQVFGIIAATLALQFFSHLPFTPKPLDAHANAYQGLDLEKKKFIGQWYVIVQLLLNASYAAIGSLLLYITISYNSYLFRGLSFISLLNAGFIIAMILCYFNNYLQGLLRNMPVQKFCFFFLCASLMLLASGLTNSNIVLVSIIIFAFGLFYGISILLLQSNIMNLMRGETIVKYNSLGMALAYTGSILSSCLIGCIIDYRVTIDLALTYVGLLGFASFVATYLFALNTRILNI